MMRTFLTSVIVVAVLLGGGDAQGRVPSRVPPRCEARETGEQVCLIHVRRGDTWPVLAAVLRPDLSEQDLVLFAEALALANPDVELQVGKKPKILVPLWTPSATTTEVPT